MPAVELGGVSIVGAGAFNPAIIHPRWLAAKELLPEDVAQHAMAGDAQPLIVTNELAAFTADWLSVQVTLNQAVFTTVEEGRELELRDIATAVFDLLPETPVDGLGINYAAHARADSEEMWHGFGDKVLPKEPWRSVFADEEWRVRDDGEPLGLRTMTVEASRPEEAEPPGIVRVEVAPSERVKPGIYVSINAHFQLSLPDKPRGTGYAAARTIEDMWEGTRTMEHRMLARLLDQL